MSEKTSLSSENRDPLSAACELVGRFQYHFSKIEAALNQGVATLSAASVASGSQRWMVAMRFWRSGFADMVVHAGGLETDDLLPKHVRRHRNYRKDCRRSAERSNLGSGFNSIHPGHWMSIARRIYDFIYCVSRRPKGRAAVALTSRLRRSISPR